MSEPPFKRRALAAALGWRTDGLEPKDYNLLAGNWRGRLGAVFDDLTVPEMARLAELWWARAPRHVVENEHLKRIHTYIADEDASMLGMLLSAVGNMSVVASRKFFAELERQTLEVIAILLGSEPAAALPGTAEWANARPMPTRSTFVAAAASFGDPAARALTKRIPQAEGSHRERLERLFASSTPHSVVQLACSEVLRHETQLTRILDELDLPHTSLRHVHDFVAGRRVVGSLESLTEPLFEALHRYDDPDAAYSVSDHRNYNYGEGLGTALCAINALHRGEQRDVCEHAAYCMAILVKAAPCLLWEMREQARRMWAG
ncbi:MAG: hypothetical protein AB7K71_04355 [Polyangiaceae bacterium]